MPTFPVEAALRRERLDLLETVTSLRPEEFEAAPTLCPGWTPRDVLSHVLAQDDGRYIYATSFGRASVANARVVERGRRRSRGELLARAALWARYPSLSSRLAAHALLGETALHHQDVLRPLGLTRDIPEQHRRAMLLNAAASAPMRLLGRRVVAKDLGGFGLGIGKPVAGSAVSLALWLAGRPVTDDELEFG